MSLVARHLEAAGIATVVLGSAIDIVEHCGVPRYLFVDMPLGNPVGRPGDTAMQSAVVDAALSLFEDATEPRTTRRLDYRFSDTDDETWRREYMEVRPEDRAMMLQKGAELRKRRAARPK